MLKPFKIIYNTIQILLLFYFFYCLVFTIQHFLAPNIGEMSVTITPNLKAPETKELTITLQKPPRKYYIFIYEEAEKQDWFYLTHQTYDKSRQKLANIFLPKHTIKYILLEGTKKNATFLISLKSKHLTNYVIRKKSCFHVIYLVPYKLYPLPNFYYCKHNTFYIDQLN